MARVPPQNHYEKNPRAPPPPPPNKKKKTHSEFYIETVLKWVSGT